MLDAVARGAPEGDPRARLHEQVARDVAPPVVLDVVRVPDPEAREVEARGLARLLGLRPDAQAVRHRVLEPVRLGYAVHAVRPDGQAVEVPPENPDVVGPRLDRVEHALEAPHAVGREHSRGARLGVGPELGELAHPVAGGGALDEDVVHEARVGHRAVVVGQAPAGERRQRRVARERDRA